MTNLLFANVGGRTLRHGLEEIFFSLIYRERAIAEHGLGSGPYSFEE
jgi:hypothetical protein